MNDCTTPDCLALTSLYLCTECMVELDALLKDVPFLIVNLHPQLQATKVTKKVGGSEGGNGTKSAGSNPPINIDAGLTRAWLAHMPARAYEAATDNPDAGQILFMARIWVTNARTLVWGHEAEIVDHKAIADKIKAVAPPMTTRQLIPWLREKAGLSLTSQTIRHYAHKGYLRAVERDPLPTYYPHEILAVYGERGKETP